MKNKTIYVSNSDEFKKAFEELNNGGNIILTDKVVATHTYLPLHCGVITVSGNTLCFDESVTITLGGETVFENITVEVKTSGVIAANFHPITFGENVTVKCDFSEESNGLYLVGGENNAKGNKDKYDDDTEITVCSGKYSRIVGFSRGCTNRTHSGHAKLTVKGNAFVRYLVAGAIGDGSTAGSASICLSDNAIIETIHLGGAKVENTLTGDVDMFVNGGDFYRFDRVGLSAVKGKRKLLYNPQASPSGLLYLAKLVLFDEIKTLCDINGHTFSKPFANPFGGDLEIQCCTECKKTELVGDLQWSAPQDVIFVSDGGFGDGSSPYFPLGSYAEAIEKLVHGGTVVLCGKCTLKANLTDQFGKTAEAFQEPIHKGKITVTCIYGDVDYREKGASLFFEKNIDYRMSGSLLFENTVFEAAEKTKLNRIIARYNPLFIGDDCKTPQRDGYKFDIIGGYLQFRYTDFDGCEIENEYENLVSIVRKLPVNNEINNLEPIKRFPQFSLRSEAAKAFNKMFDDMEKEGLKIPTVTDAMRPYYRQYALFTGYLGRLRKTFGYSFEEARKVVTRSCAVPTTSEHQWGVAVDMYHLDMTEYGSKKHHYFDITPEWAWVYENGKKYGIVLRYNADKTDITGCIYEAWHFRYVGKDVAGILMARNLSLEEYMGAKLGLLNLDSNVTVNSGNFNSVTPFSKETGLLQLTGKHFISVADNVIIKETSEELSEC